MVTVFSSGHCAKEVFHLPGNIVLRQSLYCSVAVALKDRFLFAPVRNSFLLNLKMFLVSLLLTQ